MKLENQGQFDELKKDDIIAVKWNQRSDEHRAAVRKKKIKESDPHFIGHYNMVEITRLNEVVLEVKRNIYFNIKMYLDGESTALEAYKIVG
ncbi:hypothetical protein P4H35_27490 [Paenibacillus taichungensis]|uniref:hypothetical protein n=1 Tax=Paenibacillus taichungensis TaxID=484184 RepID=UPI002DC0093F|nr:hypothetical protein [Paenibacillus taichungensis]MEC0200115.1 hypothetical protein [Paenibacillus taichungensis]